MLIGQLRVTVMQILGGIRGNLLSYRDTRKHIPQLIGLSTTFALVNFVVDCTPEKLPNFFQNVIVLFTILAIIGKKPRIFDSICHPAGRGFERCKRIQIPIWTLLGSSSSFTLCLVRSVCRVELPPDIVC